MDIQIINDKNGCRAMFYYKGHIYTCYGANPREAKLYADVKISQLKGETLF